LTQKGLRLLIGEEVSIFPLSFSVYMGLGIVLLGIGTSSMKRSMFLWLSLLGIIWMLGVQWEIRKSICGIVIKELLLKERF